MAEPLKPVVSSFATASNPYAYKPLEFESGISSLALPSANEHGYSALNDSALKAGVTANTATDVAANAASNALLPLDQQVSAMALPSADTATPPKVEEKGTSGLEWAQLGLGVAEGWMAYKSMKDTMKVNSFNMNNIKEDRARSATTRANINRVV